MTNLIIVGILTLMVAIVMSMVGKGGGTRLMGRNALEFNWQRGI